MSEQDDKGVDKNHYVDGEVPDDVRAISADIEYLGDRRIRITVAFAGAPHPVRQVPLPGDLRANPTMIDQPGAFGFDLQLAPRGPVEQQSLIGFSANSDGSWEGVEFTDYLEDESKSGPADAEYRGNTFALTADLSPYKTIPAGAEFKPSVLVTTHRYNRALNPGEDTSSWTPFFDYPTRRCTDGSATDTSDSPASSNTSSTGAYPDMDSQGFRNSHASCDSGDAPVMTGRTAKSQVVICQSSPQTFYYRGVRLSDDAPSEFNGAQPLNDTYEVANGYTTYSVSPQRLYISSGGDVLANEPMLEFRGQ
ncbi:hypothetical protein [Williamsia sterculiae]|uniref:hypothetical protein n=1 Tax=Williamsia sterculiae TaxID=1344003 RepID=UPI00117F029A|nr:hypothetical protein [Williamsia sterculiae]